jgi:hypothetical protein
MVNSAAILNDPHWLPHGFDPARGTITFIRVTRERLAQPAFLADATSADSSAPVDIPLAEIAAARPAQAPLHYIFHTAFCRSTLLVRALEQPGVSAGLSEPGIIARLVGKGDAGLRALAPAMALLARPWGSSAAGVESVFVKPTNHANALIPALMDARPQACAVLMTNPLPSFLKAVVRKGMLGRRWARQLYLELMGYAGMELGMDAREQFAMTDLQAGALAWFLSQRYFDALARRYGARVRVLDGDTFGRDPARVLDALGAFTRVPLDGAAIARGPLFAHDAKTGEDYAVKAARDEAASESAVVEDEIAKLGEWVALIARQAGVAVPVRETL